jgi:hypothetical protein
LRGESEFDKWKIIFHLEKQVLRIDNEVVAIKMQALRAFDNQIELLLHVDTENVCLCDNKECRILMCLDFASSFLKQKGQFGLAYF